MMGRTVPSYRQALDAEIGRWDGFRKALRGKELEAFDRMMNACKTYASAGGMATRTILTEAMFMSILLSQQKELMEIRESLERLEKQLRQT
jgi:predicted NACHT family NTPase